MCFQNLQVDGKRPPEQPSQGLAVPGDGRNNFQPQKTDSHEQGPYNVQGCNAHRNQTQRDLAPPQFLGGDTRDRLLRSSIKKNKKLTKEDIGLATNFQ